jgi:hypothetical protein
MTPAVQFKAVHGMDVEILEGMTACRTAIGIIPSLRDVRTANADHH